MKDLPRLLLAWLACALPTTAACQCGSVLTPGSSSASVNGAVRCSTWWDQDGPGGAPPVVVLGGSFPLAGSVSSNFLASYDPTTLALGGFQTTLLGSRVNAVAGTVGRLYVGGNFSAVASVPGTSNVAQWNGLGWSSLGSGLDGEVNALAIAANGDLYAGGSFFTAGGVPVSRVARWDGSNWTPLGSGLPGTCYALFVRGNGDLFASGLFQQAGGQPANFVARWDGSSWHALGAGLAGIAYSFAELPSGDVVAGGGFASTLGGIDHVARWNGVTWTQVGNGLPTTVQALRVAANGDLLAATGGPSPSAMRFDGATWSAVDSASTQQALTLEELPDGDVLLGGSFQQLGNQPIAYLARWDQNRWLQPGPPNLDGAILALAASVDGAVYAGGDFVFGGNGPSRIGRWNGTSFDPLGVGAGGTVYSLLVLPDDTLVAAGSFVWIGGVQSPGIAAWDGSSWSGLGSGLQGGSALALTRDANGFVVVGGSFTSAGGVPCNRVARWTGAAFAPLGSGLGNWVHALATLPDGSIVAGGDVFFPGGSCVARWNGSAWVPMGGGINGRVDSLAVLANGELVAGGEFSSVGGVLARWNGTNWTAYPSPPPPVVPVVSLQALPDGGFVAGTRKLPSPPFDTSRLLRWNGSSWSGGDGNGDVLALALAANGELHLGGAFTQIAGTSHPYHARLATTCAPAILAGATACAAPYDSIRLVPRSLPWLASTFRAEAVDLPSASVACAAIGFAPIAPGLLLSSVLPTAAPGCTLDVAADALVLLGPTNEIAVPLPNSPAVIGADLFLQVAALVLDGGGSLKAIVTTGSLQATVGTF